MISVIRGRSSVQYERQILTSYNGKFVVLAFHYNRNRTEMNAGLKTGSGEHKILEVIVYGLWTKPDDFAFPN